MRFVLFATDTESSLWTHVAQLKEAGYVVATVATIEDVLRQLETMPELPGVIVLDVRLRRATDLDALRRLRTNRHSTAIPLILLDRGDSALAPRGSFAAVVSAAAASADVVDAVARLTSSSPAR